MDKEQAIEVLKPLVNSFVDYANITMKEEDDDIVEALEMAVESLRELPIIQHEKAQFSCEGTTSDLISRKAALDAILHLTSCKTADELRAYVKSHDLNGRWSGGVMDAIRAVERMPSAQPETPCYLGSPCEYQNPDVVISQPVATDINVGDKISRQAAIDALDFEIVHMTAYCDGKNEGNPLAQYNKGLEDGKKAIEALPSAQPEPHEELLDDETLVIWTNVDMTKFSRVNVRQKGTHYGDLFYPDED